MKYLPLIWAGLWRKRLRTILTLLSIVVAFVNPLVVPIHPPPIDQFARCGLVEDFRFQLVPNYIGTAFGTCLYTIHIGRRLWMTLG